MFSLETCAHSSLYVNEAPYKATKVKNFNATTLNLAFRVVYLSRSNSRSQLILKIHKKTPVPENHFS